MTLEERRAALVDATLPLLYQHGRGVTTRLIAEAAGVAEGTIFRAFGSKDELVDDIDMSWPLEQRLVKLVGILQQRLLAVFGLMRTCGMVAPPAHDEAAHERWRRQVVARLVEVVGPDEARLSVPPGRLLHLLRLLTFSASHREIAEDQLLTPEEIVDVVLHGVLKKDCP
jgi:AcrR family transcriptional regulator